MIVSPLCYTLEFPPSKQYFRPIILNTLIPILVDISLYSKIAHFYQIYKPKMENFDRNSLQYEISLSSFKQQVTQKQMLLEKLSYQMSIKVSSGAQGQVAGGGQKKRQATCEIVQLCRRNIEEMEGVFGDIHSYFVELRLEFIYDLILQIFRNLILSFKVLSERFILSLKDKKKQEQPHQKENLHKTQKLIEEIKNKNFSELQYFDSLIRSIEMDECRLAQRKREAQKKMLFDRTMVENINASDAVNQLQILKKQMDRIIMSSIKLGDDGGTARGGENLKQVKMIKRPSEIEDQYCTSISQNTQSIFIKKMHEIVKRLYMQVRQKQKEQLLKQLSQARPPSFQKQTQTFEIEFRLIRQQQQSKQKSPLALQNQSLKKSNNSLKKQLEQLSTQIQKLQTEHKTLQEKVRHTSQLLNKKMTQLSRARSEFQYNMGKKDQTIQMLNKKIVEIQIKSQRLAEECKSHVETPKEESQHQEDNQSIFLDQNDNEDTMSLKVKSSASRTQRTSFFYQREFKATKQQNSHLRKSLSIMLDALKQQKLILEYPINDLNSDLRLGKLISKIQAISIQLLNKVKLIRLKEDQPRSEDRGVGRKKTFLKVEAEGEMKQKKNQSKENKERKFVSAETQTGQTYCMESIYTKQQQNCLKSPQTEAQPPKKPDDKLEKLKKQLINKVNFGKRTHGSVGRSRLYLHQLENRRNYSNVSLQGIKPLEEESKMRRVSKMRPAFNRKDISFEQFKFSLVQNKSQYAQKKILNRSKKPNNPVLTPKGQKSPHPNPNRRLNPKSAQIPQLFQQSYQQKQQDELVLGIHGYECVSQVKKVVQLIESKNQKKDCYVRYFINKLVEELRRVRGTRALEEILMGGRYCPGSEGAREREKSPLLSCQ